MAYRIAVIPMTLSYRQSNSCTAGSASLFKCDFVQLCSSWPDFNWHSASRGPSVIAELLV